MVPHVFFTALSSRSTSLLYFYLSSFLLSLWFPVLWLPTAPPLILFTSCFYCWLFFGLSTLVSTVTSFPSLHCFPGEGPGINIIIIIAWDLTVIRACMHTVCTCTNRTAERQRCCSYRFDEENTVYFHLMFICDLHLMLMKWRLWGRSL